MLELVGRIVKAADDHFGCIASDPESDLNGLVAWPTPRCWMVPHASEFYLETCVSRRGSWKNLE
jgi:hypothetical protein